MVCDTRSGAGSEFVPDSNSAIAVHFKNELAAASDPLGVSFNLGFILFTAIAACCMSVAMVVIGRR